MLKINPIVKWWVTPKLPEVHIACKHCAKSGISQTCRMWLYHPLRRRIAKHYLIILKKFFGLRVIGITGSAGKTTVKDMLTSVLSLDGETVSSYKNIDPIYNIPTTILKCRPSTKYLILEMGVEYPGEMDYYLWLAKPDVGVITNIYPTHTEFFKNIKGVFKEKRKLVDAVLKKGTAILNIENKYLLRLNKNIDGKTISFGVGGDVTFAHEEIIKNVGTRFSIFFDYDSKKRIRVTIPTYGRQFVSNAIAAAAAANTLGISSDNIKTGLEKYKPPEHRMNIFIEKNGSTIIDDSYNNNPKAASEALNVLNEMSVGKLKGVVFGDMLELGNKSGHYHREIGKTLSQLKLKFIIYVGDFDKYVHDEIIKSKERVMFEKAGSGDDAYRLLQKYLLKNTVILIKGSHSLKLDTLVDKLSG